jgi:type II secretory pathway pseudopilin PulG
MKRWTSGRSIRGITLIELLLVIAIIVVLFAVLFPVDINRRGGRAAMRARCMSNLRQVGLGEVMWYSDHSNQFPWEVVGANGGTLETSARGQVAPNFQALGEYIKDPSVFRCPADTVRSAAASYAAFAQTNVSYFIHLDLGTNAMSSALAGDRNLQCDGKPVSSGLLSLTTASKLGWTHELHGNAPVPSGNLLFEDAHVEWNKDPSAALQRLDAATNRVAVP